MINALLRFLASQRRCRIMAAICFAVALFLAASFVAQLVLIRPWWQMLFHAFGVALWLWNAQMLWRWNLPD